MTIKALGLFSGGLDSMIAVKLIQEQGIEVEAVAFVTDFFGKAKKLKLQAQSNGFDLEIIDISQDYLSVIQDPKYGYGKNFNPCIDCKIFMLRQAKAYAEKVGAHFLFTGEVLGQRPMSQRKTPMETIMKQSGLEGKLLRPLCAQNLPETEAEINGWVDRSKLLDIQGRSRKRQLELSKKYNLQHTQSPAGGCLLAEKDYSTKLKTLIDAREKLQSADIPLLRQGRFFTVKGTIIIVGRNKEDNDRLESEQKSGDYLMEAKECKGPITLIRGEKTPEALQLAAEKTVQYADTSEGDVVVQYGEALEQEMIVS